MTNEKYGYHLITDNGRIYSCLYPWMKRESMAIYKVLIQKWFVH